MQLEWNILSMDCYLTVGDVSNVVYKVSWKVTIIDGDHIAVTTGATDVGNEQTDSFIEYNELTETVVLGWLFDALGSDKDQIEDSLKKSVKLLKSPTSVRLSLPWQDITG
jgi:hypothetical protein